MLIRCVSACDSGFGKAVALFPVFFLSPSLSAKRRKKRVTPLVSRPFSYSGSSVDGHLSSVVASGIIREEEVR